MKLLVGITVIALLFLGTMTVSVEAQQWAAKADYADACSCNPACPCLYGSAPTLGHCEGSSLIEISEGHYGDVNLDGISVVTTYRAGEWVKHYVSDKVSDEQVKAVVQLMSTAFPFLSGVEVLETKKVPVSVERSESKVKFSVPTTTVEIEMMKGAGGEPVITQDLPSQDFPGPRFIDHTQYRSITLQHESGEQKFSYSATNGFTAKVDTGGEI